MVAVLERVREIVFPEVREDYEPEFEAAERGADLLDDMSPGWFNLVDLNTLEMSLFSTCVLGQVYGEYGLGMESLGFDINNEVGARYGFHANRGELDYNRLNASWKALVKARLTN